MFQFPRFASAAYVFSYGYLKRGGFPHSEIFGSKLICQLPEAYRRLSRPSSPSVAKASTVCAYQLDHITPKSLRLDDRLVVSLITLRHSNEYLSKRQTTLPNCKRSNDITRYRFTGPKTRSKHSTSLSVCFWALTLNRVRWWSQSGSNRRPPACKAGALPAELWPQNNGGSGRI